MTSTLADEPEHLRGLNSPLPGLRWLRQGCWAHSREMGFEWVLGSPASPHLQPHHGSPWPGWPHPSLVSGLACGQQEKTSSASSPLGRAPARTQKRVVRTHKHPVQSGPTLLPEAMLGKGLGLRYMACQSWAWGVRGRV